MTAEELAELHARCFGVPRPWTAKEFLDLLTMPGCFLLEYADGFLLGRALAGEGELLTLAVAPQAQRQGIGRKLTQDFIRKATALGAKDLFLEVSAHNHPAILLYSSLGWQQVGARKEYYGPGQDAIMMRHGD